LSEECFGSESPDPRVKIVSATEREIMVRSCAPDATRLPHRKVVATHALGMLLAAVSTSPIKVAAARPRLPNPAEWARLRRSADADAFVLAWIASHARPLDRRRTH
jgi:hypothetical protein